MKKLYKSNVKSSANVDQVKEITHPQSINPVDKSVAQKFSDDYADE
jgi:hypothetical protein